MNTSKSEALQKGIDRYQYTLNVLHNAFRGIDDKRLKYTSLQLQFFGMVLKQFLPLIFQECWETESAQVIQYLNRTTVIISKGHEEIDQNNPLRITSKNHLHLSWKKENERFLATSVMMLTIAKVLPELKIADVHVHRLFSASRSMQLLELCRTMDPDYKFELPEYKGYPVNIHILHAASQCRGLNADWIIIDRIQELDKDSFENLVLPLIVLKKCRFTMFETDYRDHKYRDVLVKYPDCYVVRIGKMITDEFGNSIEE